MSGTAVRAVRGATTVEENTREAIEKATRALLQEIMRRNLLDPGQIISAFFTLTRDLDAGFPAAAARQLPGWNHVPMLCAEELTVPGQLSMCIRVMIHCQSSRRRHEIQHVYLCRAKTLRPDLS